MQLQIKLFFIFCNDHWSTSYILLLSVIKKKNIKQKRWYYRQITLHGILTSRGNSDIFDHLIKCAEQIQKMNRNHFRLIKKMYSDVYQNNITRTWKARKSSHRSHVRSFSCFPSAAAMLNYEISYRRDLKSKWKIKYSVQFHCLQSIIVCCECGY